MNVYHVTSAKNAKGITSNGFRDSTGRYMTANDYTGVWVSDSPLDINEMGGAFDACFEIEIEENIISKYEWIEDEKTYREWLVPATILNRYPRRIMSQEEVDELGGVRILSKEDLDKLTLTDKQIANAVTTVK